MALNLPRFHRPPQPFAADEEGDRSILLRKRKWPERILVLLFDYL